MDDTMWELVREERESLTRMVAPLSQEAWATPSVCAEWTVREVFAHVLMTPSGEPGVPAMTRALVRARGHLWTAGRDVAVEFARRPTDELIASMRRLAGSRDKPVFVMDHNILLDLVVHGQDIAVPLGIDRAVPPAAGRPALERAWSMGWPFHARRRLAGVRLVAEDASGWTAGEGPEVSGPAGALAMLMTGRAAAALPMLHGPGTALLAERLGTRAV